MPVDTDLTVPNASAPSGGFLANPLGVVSDVMRIRGQGIEQQNQQLTGGILQQNLALVQKQMAARAKLGQILSSAPSIDAGLNSAMQDPEVAPYVTQEFGQVRAGLLANQQFQNEVQAGTISGYDNLLKSVATSGGDPDRFNAAVKSGLDLLSPQAKTRATEATSDMVTSLTSGLPKDPAARKQAFQARVAGWAAAHGMSQDTLNSIYGTPSVQDLGNVKQPVMTAPAAGGQQGQTPGSVTPAGNPLSVGLAPIRQTTEGGGVVERPGVAGPAVGGPAAAATPPAPPAPDTVAGDGKPLIADPSAYITTKFDKQGQPILTGPNAKGAAVRAESFEGEELHQYNLVQNGMARAKEIDQALDNLARGGGWQTPGAAGEARNAIAKFVNTFTQITGQKLPFDPNKVASWEQFTKDSMPAALALLTQNLGQQKEAAQTIQSIMKSVPTIENTYLGGKLVNASMIAMFQRAIDERQAVDWARQHNGGDIQGAELAFNKEHPPEQYAEQVLQRYGLTNGQQGVQFKDKAALVNAVRQGLVTREDARKIKSAQGFE